MARVPAVVWVVVIAAIIAVSGAFGFLVTTFFFAFSGGQFRMVPVVQYGAWTAILASAIATAVAAWRLRSGPNAAIAAVIASGAAWTIAVIVEFGLSFFLGA